MKKILIVDDDTRIRSIYKRLLQGRDGYYVIDAPDWQLATDLIVKERGLDLVLLDINMPIVDGSAFYDVIRLFDPHIKVIVVSAYPLEEQKRLLLKADDYFDKSRSTDVLLQKVEHVFEGLELEKQTGQRC